jgi:hypothetical protein
MAEVDNNFEIDGILTLGCGYLTWNMYTEQAIFYKTTLYHI